LVLAATGSGNLARCDTLGRQTDKTRDIDAMIDAVSRTEPRRTFLRALPRVPEEPEIVHEFVAAILASQIQVICITEDIEAGSGP
jgi:hypothetical protein